MNSLPQEKYIAVANLLREGEGIRSIERKTGVHTVTIAAVHRQIYHEDTGNYKITSYDCPICKRLNKPDKRIINYPLPEDKWFILNMGNYLCFRCRQSFTMFVQNNTGYMWVEKLPKKEFELVILQWVAHKIEQLSVVPRNQKNPSKRTRNFSKRIYADDQTP